MPHSAAQPSFRDWLIRQAHRDDPVGDIARDMLDDPEWPASDGILAEHRDYLTSVNASPVALNALQQAWDEWSAA
jgi:uncharacterized protein YozE (UPF0346 family)